MTDTLFRSYRAVVAPEWIDVNDHMNARYYASVIYDAHVMFTEHIGLGEDYVAARHCGKVVVESHMVYERELRLGDEIGVVFLGPWKRESLRPTAERVASDDYAQLYHFIAASRWEAALLER